MRVGGAARVELDEQMVCAPADRADGRTVNECQTHADTLPNESNVR